MKFKMLLRAKKITQKKLALKLGVTQSLISQWILGICQPQLKAVVKIAEILSVTVEEVLACFTN